MIVTELDTSAYPAIITGTPTISNLPRSTDTLHLSTIYRDLAESALLSKGDAEPWELEWYAAGGFLWEHVFGMAFQASVVRGEMEEGEMWRPDEVELDGIVGSPDALRLDEDCLRVIELKFRWMSSNKFDALEKYFWAELIQCRGYCRMVGTTEAELHVFFCNGDYRPPRPVVRAVRLEFDEREIEENWLVILAHARRRGWL